MNDNYNIELPLPEWWGSCLTVQINNKLVYVYYAQSDGSLYSRIRFKVKNFKNHSLELPEIYFTYKGFKCIKYDSNMTKDKYPEMYDDEIINEMIRMIDKYKCLFLLIWFGLLEEHDLIDYHLARISLYEIINHVSVKKKVKKELLKCKTINELDETCKKYFLYQLKR